MSRWLLELRGSGLAVRLAVLLAVVVAVFALVGPIAGFYHGGAGLAAAALAAGLCLVGAAVALVLAGRFGDAEDAWKGVLVGMVPRMGIPLGFALFFHARGGVLADAGLLYCLIAVYPITLAVETALSLPVTKSHRRCSGDSVGNGVDA